jgi:hypothetical protein
VDRAAIGVTDAMGDRLNRVLGAMENRQRVINTQMGQFVEQIKTLVSQSEAPRKLQDSSSAAEPTARSMDRKPISLLLGNLVDLSSENCDLVAKTVSSVIRHAIPRKFDQRWPHWQQMKRMPIGSSTSTLERLEFLIRYGRLPPWSKVLDIGCGSRHRAAPLPYYLTHEGGYYVSMFFSDLIGSRRTPLLITATQKRAHEDESIFLRPAIVVACA